MDKCVKLKNIVKKLKRGDYKRKNMRLFKNSEIDEIAQILKNDGVVAVPTDTVYGLCAGMNSKKARENLIKIKNRPENKNFPIMCANLEQIKKLAQVSEKTEKIIKSFMPGPITLIFLKTANVPEFVNKGSNEIGIRMATSKVLEELILKIGEPIFMTSANLSGEPVCKTIEEIQAKFKNIDGVLEGKVSYGQASTIVDCTAGETKLIREGPISIEEILKVIEK